MALLIFWIGALVVFTGGFIGGFLFYSYLMQIHYLENNEKIHNEES